MSRGGSRRRTYYGRGDDFLLICVPDSTNKTTYLYTFDAYNQCFDLLGDLYCTNDSDVNIPAYRAGIGIIPYGTSTPSLRFRRYSNKYDYGYELTLDSLKSIRTNIGNLNTALSLEPVRISWNTYYEANDSFYIGESISSTNYGYGSFNAVGNNPYISSTDRFYNMSSWGYDDTGMVANCMSVANMSTYLNLNISSYYTGESGDMVYAPDSYSRQYRYDPYTISSYKATIFSSYGCKCKLYMNIKKSSGSSTIVTLKWNKDGSTSSMGNRGIIVQMSNVKDEDTYDYVGYPNMYSVSLVASNNTGAATKTFILSNANDTNYVNTSSKLISGYQYELDGVTYTLLELTVMNVGICHYLVSDETPDGATINPLDPFDGGTGTRLLIDSVEVL